MTINITTNDKTVTINPVGNIDYISAPEVETALTENATRADKLILDMKDVGYIASAGLRVMLNADDLMADKSGFFIANVNEAVKEILDMTGFSDVLKFI